MPSSASHQLPDALISNLSNKCGFKRHWAKPIENEDDLEVCSLDLTPLKINVGHFVPFIKSKRLSSYDAILPQHLEEVLPEVKEYAKAAYTNFVVLIVGGKLQYDEKHFRQEIGFYNIAILDKPIIEAILEATDFNAKAKLLAQGLVRFLGRESLSPYLYGSPAFGGRFFGRSAVIQRIFPRAKNYTIIGNRRIGKTSVLKEVKNRLRLQNDKIRTVEVYGGLCESTAQTLQSILHSLNLHRDAEGIVKDPSKVKKFPRLIHSLIKRENRPVAVFIDELDYILEFDAKQKYQLLDVLRATFLSPDESSCSIYFAGFRKVMEAMVRLNTPLHNFTDKIKLGLLSRDETSEMVTVPLSRLGIKISGSDLPEIIYRETGGHPELIQMHCAQIIRQYETTRKTPDSTTLIKAVLETNEYKQTVHGTFLANTNPLEALLCYLLINMAVKASNVYDFEFGYRQADNVLRQVGIYLDTSSIETLITNLEVTGIIAKAEGEVELYKFSVPQLANYCMGLDLEFRIEKTLEEVQRRRTPISALLSTPE